MPRRLSLLLLCASTLLHGCGFVTKEGGGKFFTGEDGSSSTGGSGTAASNFLFVANAGANSVTGLGISTTGTMAGLSGSPLNFSVAPTSLTVSRDNKYLYVGTSAAIFGFSIASDGTLASLNNGAALGNCSCVDLQTSPDGKWLLALDGSATSLDLYSIATDGTLSPGPGSGISYQANGTLVPKVLRFNPAGTLLVAAMGTGGELVFGFNTSTGVLTYLSQTLPPALTSDNGIAIDSTGTYLYEARSGNNAGLVVNTISANGVLTPTTATTYTAGTQPYSVVLDNSGTYVYVANRGDNTVSGWTIGTGAALTAIAGSPFSSGVAVTSLGADSTGKYIAAAAYSGAPDVTLYGLDTVNAGRLYSVSSSSTGTNASLVALSH